MHEQQSLHDVLVAKEIGLVAYGLQSRQVIESSRVADHERQGHPYKKDCPWYACTENAEAKVAPAAGSRVRHNTYTVR